MEEIITIFVSFILGYWLFVKQSKIDRQEENITLLTKYKR